MIDISPYKFNSRGGSGKADYIHVMPMPDTYRGLYRGHSADIGPQYAAHLAKAVATIQSNGKGIAGFICESILSCGGQIPLPEGYLQHAYSVVREAGGLCIADEVQVGFGRVGSHFWGFELQDVVPDIVVMGKPIGNGHPLGAVVCTPAVAAAFNNGMEYFNTFGGNPVSCTIGKTVLEVIEAEQLQANAARMGHEISSGLGELQKEFPIIGDVRGPGLFIGIELVKNPETLEPAAAEASYLTNRMRRHGILMSTDGPLHNVLKIKPPMCFNSSNVDLLLSSLRKILAEEPMQL
ncbi:MAG: aminotransferase class III-fold pyridoxal phosphate-dependent enzyme [Bacteroidota bacterium]